WRGLAEHAPGSWSTVFPDRSRSGVCAGARTGARCWRSSLRPFGGTRGGGLRGEAGGGETALSEDLLASAGGLSGLRGGGVESEMDPDIRIACDLPGHGGQLHQRERAV